MRMLSTWMLCASNALCRAATSSASCRISPPRRRVLARRRREARCQPRRSAQMAAASACMAAAKRKALAPPSMNELLAKEVHAALAPPQASGASCSQATQIDEGEHRDEEATEHCTPCASATLLKK